MFAKVIFNQLERMRVKHLMFILWNKHHVMKCDNIITINMLHKNIEYWKNFHHFCLLATTSNNNKHEQCCCWENEKVFWFKSLFF